MYDDPCRRTIPCVWQIPDTHEFPPGLLCGDIDGAHLDPALGPFIDAPRPPTTANHRECSNKECDGLNTRTLAPRLRYTDSSALRRVFHWIRRRIQKNTKAMPHLAKAMPHLRAQRLLSLSLAVAFMSWFFSPVLGHTALNSASSSPDFLTMTCKQRHLIS